MNTKETTVNSNVETLDINLDEIFNGAPSAGDVTLPEETKPQTNILSGLNKKADFSFADPDEDGVDDLSKKESEQPEADTEAEPEAQVETKEEKVEQVKDKEESANDILDTLDDETDEDVEQKKKRGRKSINGISDVFSKLIKDDKIVPFDDEKSLEEYSAKDWEELIEANLEERANQVRRETPKQFFASLPEELQIAARYVADGGTDIKGLFNTLGSVEETKQLSLKSETDQETIIKEYLGATGYGTSDEIAEEIEIWKDLGKLEKQAAKFKPKLDKMQEKIVVKKLEEQDLKKKQQEQASKKYMSSVYETLKEGTLGDIKVDRKTQAMLYNGLVQPSYPSVSGKNTNLLGHLLEKYQFVEPNYTLISEALWLLQDPEGYKAKIMDKGAQQSVEKTVRKLKTAAASNSSASLGVQEKEDTKRKSSRKKLPRTNNIFKRI
tara:strand:+ start:17620 stop:18939 length:1320 start_codon:yes stop_codon:yes gene_type:complete